VALGERLLLMGSRFLSPEALVALFEGAGARTLEQRVEGNTVRVTFTR
jgi:hypothetical protein